jgi:hypothetical protein
VAKEEWARAYQMPKIKPEDAGGQWILSKLAIEKAVGPQSAGTAGSHRAWL